MLFLGGRTRNLAVSGGSMQDRSIPQKMGHSCILCGCLSIVTGLILIIVGIISELKKTTFIGVGVITLGVGFFLTTFVCFYGKLDICYNNWAYRSRVLPSNAEAAQATPADAARKPTVVKLPELTEKEGSIGRIASQTPITIVSEAEIRKVVISPAVQLAISTTNADSVT